MSHETTDGIYNLVKLRQECNNGRHFNFVLFDTINEHDIIPQRVNTGCFSLSYPISFYDNKERKYSCSLQYMMSQKALLSNDQEAFNKIMKGSSMSEIVEFGRHLKHFDQKKWDQNSEQIVYQGNYYKFSQNDQLKAFLLSFPLNTIFVNADPQNNYWGIKLSVNDQKALNPNKWQGFNKLGFQLTRVRDDLIKQTPELPAPIEYPVTTTEGLYSLESLRKAWKEGKRFNFVYFWQIGEIDYEYLNESCFCQWFPSDFHDDAGTVYNCCEQYMMAQKAVLFNDKQTLGRILQCSDPHLIKKLGREVKNFDSDVWDKNCQDVVFQANLFKFGQNEKLNNYMLSFSRDTIFVEASPLDAIWGIKLSADNKLAQNPMNWKGMNYLGFQLTHVRDTLLES